MALNSLSCADVPLSTAHSLTVSLLCFVFCDISLQLCNFFLSVHQ